MEVNAKESIDNLFSTALDFTLNNASFIYYNRGIQSGSYTFTIGTSPTRAFVWMYTQWQSDGSAINWPAQFNILRNEYNNDSAIYAAFIYWDGNNYDLWVYKKRGIDIDPPILSAAAVENLTRNILNLAFNEPIDITEDGWSINTDGTSLSIISVTGSGTTNPNFTLSRDIVNGETITLDYDSETGDTKDGRNNELEDLINFSVTNNVEGNPVFSFQTNKSGAFHAAIGVASATLLKWDMGDGTEIIGKTIDHTYLDSSLKTVKVYLHTVPSVSLITSVLLNSGSTNQGIQGILDLSQLTGLTTINLNYQTSITGIVLADNLDLVLIWGFNSGIESLDLSGVNSSGGTLDFRGASSFSSFSQAPSGTYSSVFYMTGIILTSIDVSNYIFTNILQISGTLLTSITLPSSGTPTNINFSGSPITTIDISGMISTNLGGVGLQSCSLNQAAVDGVLSDLNTYFSSNTPVKDLTIYLNLGSNASPTDGASNADLLNLISVFTGAGYTLTYYIN